MRPERETENLPGLERVPAFTDEGVPAGITRTYSKYTTAPVSPNAANISVTSPLKVAAPPPTPVAGSVTTTGVGPGIGVAVGVDVEVEVEIGPAPVINGTTGPQTAPADVLAQVLKE